MNNIKILLIDDDKWIRNSLVLYFQEEGCSIMGLETAEEGLEEAAENDFDIVIADYRLPGMNGLKFLEKIQALHPNTLQILITAYRDKQVKTEADQMGIHEIIDKPISAHMLEASVLHLLSTRGRKKRKI